MNSNSSALIIPPPSTTVAATNDIRAIRPPVEVPNDWAWIWWMLGALVLMGVVTAAILWWRKKQGAALSAPIIPPHVRAKNRLREALTLIHDPRLFGTAVSDALRIYLEERFNFHAPDRTTDEFLLELQASRLLLPDQKQSLSEFLQSCDLVKFARFEPTEAALRELHDSALRLVDETQYEAIQASPAVNGASPRTSPAPVTRTDS